MGEIDARLALEHFNWYDLLAAFKALAKEELIEPFDMELLRVKISTLESPSDSLLRALNSAIEEVLGIIDSAHLKNRQDRTFTRRYQEYEQLYYMLEVV